MVIPSNRGGSCRHVMKIRWYQRTTRKISVEFSASAASTNSRTPNGPNTASTDAFELVNIRPIHLAHGPASDSSHGALQTQVQPEQICHPIHKSNAGTR